MTRFPSDAVADQFRGVVEVGDQITEVNLVALSSVGDDLSIDNVISLMNERDVLLMKLRPQSLSRSETEL